MTDRMILSEYPTTFQLTSSRRGWLSWLFGICCHSIFQLTSSRRGWPLAVTGSETTSIFQLTSSRRGWQPLFMCPWPIRYFNSHPHEEDDRKILRFIYSFFISTHILTKRMTQALSPSYVLFHYFNSHPHEEDDGILKNIGVDRMYFNSHPHEEDDKNPYRVYEKNINISTHILTKRMTYSKIK